MLKNRYELKKKIGQGGFGETYKAYDHLINEIVAIKESSVSLSHEAKILHALRNVPYISHIYNHFKENGKEYIVMRYIEGISLSSRLYNSDNPITPAELKSYLPSLCMSLNQMHRLHIIHRDISPGNIMLTKDGMLYLIDFGAATSTHKTSLINNQTFSHMGLNSPEHLDFNSQGSWSDIYSLCSTIVYLLSGEGVPLPQDRIAFDPIIGLLTKLSISSSQQNALMKGLQIDPANRYSNILDFARDFLGYELDNALSVDHTGLARFHAITYIGSKPVNQDNFMIDQFFPYANEDCEIKGEIPYGATGLHVVAISDGVSSSCYSEFASKAVIQAVSHFVSSYANSTELPSRLLEDLLTQINEKIISLGNKIGQTAATIAIFMWIGNKYFGATIGDSPAYIYSLGKLRQLTHPHTLAALKFSEGEAVTAHDFHTLTAYLGKKGSSGKQMASYFEGIIEKDTTLLLCTDGVSFYTTEDHIKHVLKKPDSAIHKLFKPVYKKKNSDNCTAIIVDFSTEK